MLTKTKGIVLQRTKYADTGLIIKIFTEKFGNLSFFVKNGFNKKNKSLNALLSPLSLVEINFDYQKKLSLQYFKEIATYYFYHSIPFNFIKNTIFIFYSELISKLLYESGEDELLYEFLEKKLIELDKMTDFRPDIHLIFMYELSKLLGFGPENNYSENCCYFSISNGRFDALFQKNDSFLSKEASFYLHKMINFSENVEKIPLPVKSTRNELLYGLIKFYMFHNEQIKTINSCEILSTVLK